MASIDDDIDDFISQFDKQAQELEEEQQRQEQASDVHNGNGKLAAAAHVVDFELTSELKEAEIVNRFSFIKKTNVVQVLLNHQYNAKSIIFSVHKKDWNKTHDVFEKLLKQRGISREHIALLSDVLDSNYDLILSLGPESDSEQRSSSSPPSLQHQNGDGGKEGSESAAQKLLKLSEDQCSEVFLDQFGTPYAAVKIGEHVETLPLKDSRFRNWLYRIYYTSENNVLNSETVSNVLNILKAKAEFDGTSRNLSLRVANISEEPFTIYYDLGNKDWQVVKITPEGWSIENSPIIFRRYKSQRPQVYPSREYPRDVFDTFIDLINVKGEYDRVLIKGYIISLFYPNIPKPISIVIAEHGSAKTTEHELEKKIVDPSGTETLAFPRDINELIQKLSHNYVAYFDNVSKIADWQSDQLCRAATGSGFSKRELYTDDEDVIYNFIRCTGINGISIAGLKADLLDRSILRKREPIPKEKRRRKEDVIAEFDSIKLQLLGSIFDVLVKVLRVKTTGGIELKERPRMADFAEIAEIACRSMGYDDKTFIKAYDKNIELQVEEAIAASLISNAITKLMEDKPQWMGTATQLLDDLEQIALTLKINTNSKAWPKAPNVLSGRLNEVKTNLREIGIIIDSEAAKNPTTRIKTILVQNSKLCKQSFGSLESFEDKKHAQVAGDNSNDSDKSDRSYHSDPKQSFYDVANLQ